MESKCYYRELECYHKTDEKIRRRIGIDGYYDLSKLPSQTMQEQFRAFLLDRGRHVSLRTIRLNRRFFEQICAAIQRVKKPPDSFLDWDVAKWVMTLEMWMLENGVPLYRKKVSVYGTESRCEARQIGYLKSILKFLQPEDTRPEQEKDVWDLSKLGIQIKENPIYNVKTINFTGILQSAIREEVKRAIYLHLKQEKIGAVKREITSMSQFSKYLLDKQIEIQSCAEINRELLEEYLVYKATDGYPGSSSSNNILALRSVLESVGKIFQYDNLERLFINTDIPPEVQPEFKAYSDTELKRLNAQITKLDVQITRCMVIHQMLGTRISDTLTLRRDCLIKRNGLDIIRIQQVKTRTYEKPVSADLAALIQKAIDYIEERYGATEYIFVDEKDTKRPLQNTTVKHKVLQLILKEDLRDDDGKLFKFNTHMFRRSYGVKLTELHLDDWTIAKLLGHKNVSAVKHYRKMSNQLLADETRRARAEQTRILLNNLGGWGEDYEQIRQNDRSQSGTQRRKNRCCKAGNP